MVVMVSLGFKSWAGLSVPFVLLSWPDRVLTMTFLPPHFLDRGFCFDLFLFWFQEFLSWIFRFAFLWLCTLISFRSRSRSTNSTRASSDGVDGFSGYFSDFLRFNILIWEHCSTFDRKANFSVCPLMLSWISPAATSMSAFTVLKNAPPPEWEGSWCRLPCREWWNLGDEEIL